MLPTVNQVLRLDVIQRGHPRWIAGQESGPNEVRWVHISELVDIAHLLRGGELVLTTGVALPDDEVALSRYVSELAEVGIAGLIVELGRHYQGDLPPGMIQTAARLHVPLIALQREVAFVRVTEVVHALIIDAQLDELRRSEELHSAFTELTLKGAGVQEILRQVAKLSGLPVVLENLNHQVIDLDAAGNSPREILADWESRSRAAVMTDRVSYDAATGLLISRVGARGEDWARLALLRDDAPTTWHYMLVERATTSLALGRLVEREEAGERRQGQRTLLAAILDHSRSDAELTARAEGLGIPVGRRQLVALTVTPKEAPGPREPDVSASSLRPLADDLTRISRQLEVPMLVGVFDEGELKALCSLPPGCPAGRTLESVARLIHDLAPFKIVVGVGSVGRGLPEARRSLVESGHVSQVARLMPDRLYHELGSLGIHSLLHVLKDDARLQSFVERELGPLLNSPDNQRRRLIETLDAYLSSGGNKNTAARKARISRSVLYDRLRYIESLLGMDLNDAVQTTSLHVALLAWSATGRSAVHA